MLHIILNVISIVLSAATIIIVLKIWRDDK